MKGFIVGLIASSLMFFSIFVFGDPIEKQISVVYNNVKLVIDGIPVVPVNEKGEAVEPFAYNGTTYLPVRAIAKAFGKEVNWDRETNTIYIGKKDNAKEVAKEVWIEDIVPLNTQTSILSQCSKWNPTEDKVNTEETYQNGMKYGIYHYLGNGWAYNEYLLNSEYKQIQGKFVLTQASKNSNIKAALEIYGDDKLLYTSQKMTGGVLPIDFNIDISNVKILRVKIVHEENYYTATAAQNMYYYGLVNTKLVKK